MTKKVIISQPMQGKSVEQIKTERAELVAALTAKGYEVEDTVLTFSTPVDYSTDRHSLFCLGRVLSLLAAVDLVVFMEGWEKARGCRIERNCCVDYNIPLCEEVDVASLPNVK